MSKFAVIAMTCIGSFAGAQNLCMSALSARATKSSTDAFIRMIMVPGYFTGAEKPKELAPTGFQMPSIRQSRSYPYLLTDLLFEGRGESVFKSQIRAKVEESKELTDCWMSKDDCGIEGLVPEKRDASLDPTKQMEPKIQLADRFKGASPPRKYHFSEKLERVEQRWNEANHQNVPHKVFSIVPGRKMFVTIEIRTLKNLYNDIRKNFTDDELRKIADEGIGMDRQIAMFARGAESEFVFYFTFKSMKDVGYEPGNATSDEIADHMANTYPNPKYLRRRH